MRQSNIPFFLLAVAVGVSLFIRIYQLGGAPTSLYWDEVAQVVDARVVSALGTDMHGQPGLQPLFLSYGDYKAPVLIWLATISFKLFGASAVVFRSIAAVIGLTSCVFVGLLAQELFPKQRQQKLLFITSFAAALTIPWSIFFSRVGFESFIGQFLLTVGVVLWLKALKATSTKHTIALTCIAAGALFLSVLSYVTLKFSAPVLLLTCIAVFPKKITVRNRSEKIRNLIATIAVFAALGASAAYLQTSQYYRQSQQYRLSTPSLLTSDTHILTANEWQELSGSPVSRLIFNRRVVFARSLIENMSAFFSPQTILFQSDNNLRHGTGVHGLLFFSQGILLLIGIWALATKGKLRALLFLLAWWILGILPAALPEDIPHAQRSIAALSPLSALVGYGLFSLFKTYRKERKIFSVLALLLGALIIELAAFSHYYFGPYQTLSREDWQYSHTQTALAAQKAAESVAQVIVVHPDERFYLWLIADNRINPQEIVNAQARSSEPMLDQIGPYSIVSSIRKIDDFSFTQKHAIVGSQETLMQYLDTHPQKNDLCTLHAFNGRASILECEQ